MMICSSYQLPRRDPDFFFHPLSHKSEVGAELQEISHLIPLNQTAPEFAVVARHYEWIRTNYTKNETGFLVSRNDKEATYLTAYRLIQVFAAAYQRGVFEAQAKFAASSPSQTSPARASAAASAASSVILSRKKSKVDLPIPEEGVIIAVNSGHFDIEFYVRFNPTAVENQLSIVRISTFTILGRGGFGVIYKVLNVSKGVFEALKVAKNEKHTTDICVTYLKREYTILTSLHQKLQQIPINSDYPIQAAPHQLITFPDRKKVMKVAYLVKLYSAFNLKSLFTRSELYRQISFQKRLILCMHLLHGFQTLSKLGVHYCDISSENILLLPEGEKDFFPYISDFGGVEYISEFQKSLCRGLSKATPAAVFPQSGDILVIYRPQNMSTLDLSYLSNSRHKIKKLIADDPTLRGIKGRIAQFQNEIFPELLAIKARQNVFAIGKLLCETLTGGMRPYSINAQNGFPKPDDIFDRALKIDHLKNEIELPNNLLHFQIPFDLIEKMLSQNPGSRPTLDSIVTNWNFLVSTWDKSDSDRDMRLYYQANELQMLASYQPNEEALLKSKLGTYLPKEQALRIGTLINGYILNEYVIAMRSDFRFQILQIKDESRQSFQTAADSAPEMRLCFTLWDGNTNVTRPCTSIYKIDIKQLMAEEAAADEKVEASASVSTD